MFIQASPIHVRARASALTALLCVTLATLSWVAKAKADAHNLEGRWVLSGDLHISGSRGRDRVAPAYDWSLGAFGAAGYHVKRQLAIGAYGFFGRHHIDSTRLGWDVTDVSAGLNVHVGIPMGRMTRLLIWPTAGYAWSRSDLTFHQGDPRGLQGSRLNARDTIFATAESPIGALHRFEVALLAMWAWRLSDSVELALGPGVVANVLLAENGNRSAGDVSYATSLQTRINYFTGGSQGAATDSAPATSSPFARRGDWLLSGHLFANRWWPVEGRQNFTPARRTEISEVTLTAEVQHFVVDQLALGGSINLARELNQDILSNIIERRSVGVGVVATALAAMRRGVGFATRASLSYTREFHERTPFLPARWRGRTMSLTLNPMLMLRIANRLALGVGPYATGKDYVGSGNTAGAEPEVVYGLSAALFGTVGRRAPGGVTR